jgi:hypothetical protein
MLALLSLPGCGIVETIQEMSAQTEAVVAAIETETGEQPTIGWRISNGTLTEVTVNFRDMPDNDLTVIEFTQVVKTAIAEHIDAEPQRIFITIDVSD